ncbi:hypothetical protein L9F63_005305, partial [Diploptera punctata]
FWHVNVLSHFVIPLAQISPGFILYNVSLYSIPCGRLVAFPSIIPLFRAYNLLAFLSIIPLFRAYNLLAFLSIIPLFRAYNLLAFLSIIPLFRAYNLLAFLSIIPLFRAYIQSWRAVRREDYLRLLRTTVCFPLLPPLGVSKHLYSLPTSLFFFSSFLQNRIDLFL